MHLAAHFPGVNHTTVWSDPASGSHIDFASFARLAQTAERAKFDFFFLAEGMRLREHAGRLHDLDVVGRPDAFTILSAIAAVTERLGLVATITTTYSEPYEVARELATLDHLSGGRAGWNLVTSADPFTGANFRRGAYLPYADRYERGTEHLETARALWDEPGPFARHGRQVELEGSFDIPRMPQGRPVVIQAGDSDDGREFAARHADGIFTGQAGLELGRPFFADVKRRLARYGRRPDDIKILPGTTFVLGDTDADARDQARHVALQQISGPTAMVFLEQLWNRDLSAYDPDGPLPAVDPDVAADLRNQGSTQSRAYPDRIATANEWRAIAERDGLSIRELMIRLRSRHTFVGSARTIADAMTECVEQEACDGFILVPHITPGGLDRFADEVVPLLQERGIFRADYEGPTLRDHLGLAHPAPGAAAAA
jgi:alkanesulfonate monooxygenase SsuD/methylene tetrahydromethanopterin reductase-like flavin-dependent oxidoreductase (luciferase family)